MDGSNVSNFLRSPVGVGVVPTPVGASYSPTSLTQQWRSHVQQQKKATAQIVELELPSGMRVQTMRPPLLLLMREGKIPDAVSSMVEEMIRKASKDGEQALSELITEKFKEDPVGMYQNMLRLYKSVWMAGVLEPIFVEDEDKIPNDIQYKLTQITNEEDRYVVPLDVVEERDFAYYFNWAQGMDENLESFRQNWDKSLELASVGQTV